MIGTPTVLLEKEVLSIEEKRPSQSHGSIERGGIENGRGCLYYIRYSNNRQFLFISLPLHPSIPSVSSSIPSLTFHSLANWINLLPLHHLPTSLPNTHDWLDLLPEHALADRIDLLHKQG